MSAWAVPLRQGALKETRTRPPGRPYGVVGEGRAQEVAEYSLELFAVVAVGGGRGVEIPAEGREGHRRQRCGLGAGSCPKPRPCVTGRVLGAFAGRSKGHLRDVSVMRSTHS